MSYLKSTKKLDLIFPGSKFYSRYKSYILKWSPQPTANKFNLFGVCIAKKQRLINSLPEQERAEEKDGLDFG